MRGSSDTLAGSGHLATTLCEAFLALQRLGVLTRETYSMILRQTLDASPFLLSTWTVWEPDALDGRDADFRNTPGHDDSGRFVACWHRAAGAPRLVPVVGYDRPGEGDWYWIPRRRLVPCRLEPIDYRFGPLRVRIASRIVPLVIEGRFCGAVGIDLEAPAESHRSRMGRPRQVCVHPERTTCTGRELLSPRENEVFHWLELGKTNEEIGIILGISHHTVKNHLENIFQKLGVHNRHEAVVSAK